MYNVFEQRYNNIYTAQKKKQYTSDLTISPDFGPTYLNMSTKMEKIEPSGLYFRTDERLRLFAMAKMPPSAMKVSKP